MSTPQGMRLCPTRSDGEASLIAHIIDETECQKRQREHFHKCPTCVHFNARNAPTPAPLAAAAMGAEARREPVG
jgi:hypothetical protein